MVRERKWAFVWPGIFNDGNAWRLQMRKKWVLFLCAALLSLLGYTVYSATNHDISLNEPAPFPVNM